MVSSVLNIEEDLIFFHFISSRLILLCFIHCYVILLSHILSCFALLYLFYFISFNSVLFHSILFYFTLFHFNLFHFTLFHFTLFHFTFCTLILKILITIMIMIMIMIMIPSQSLKYPRAGLFAAGDVVEHHPGEKSYLHCFIS